MINTALKNSLKWGGVAALLASTLAISDSVSAINVIISNTSSDGLSGFTNTGQSFVNAPSGTGAAILLNDWTFAFFDAVDASTAAGLTLNIYAGVGNGGALQGSSSTTAITTLAGFPDSVTWTFAGGLSLIDKNTYTASITSGSLNFLTSTSNPYPNGTLTANSVVVGSIDTVFQGNFSSAAAVPFEFEPTGGLAVLGGAWLLRKRLSKKQATKI